MYPSIGVQQQICTRFDAIYRVNPKRKTDLVQTSACVSTRRRCVLQKFTTVLIPFPNGDVHQESQSLSKEVGPTQQSHSDFTKIRIAFKYCNFN